MWEDYIRSFFSDDRPNVDIYKNDNLTGPPIMKEEIEKAIRNSKTNKATGPDEIPAKLIKLLDDEGIRMLQKHFNKIYDTGYYPDQWLLSTFIPLPKKKNAQKCEVHRLISLMSHSLKIFLKIIHQRLYEKSQL